MNDKTQDLDNRVSARRRLIRGAFAAPAVLTMYSGGALAQTSATCVAKANDSPATGEVIDSGQTSSDTYLRVQLDVTATNEYWLRASSIPVAYRTGATGVPGSGKLQRFGALSSDSATYNKLFGSVAAEGSVSGLSPSTKYAALRFDRYGKLVGVGSTTTDGSAITHSCWTSTH